MGHYEGSRYVSDDQEYEMVAQRAVRQLVEEQIKTVVEIRKAIETARAENQRVANICLSYAPDSGTTHANIEVGHRRIAELKQKLFLAMLYETREHWMVSGNFEFIKCAKVLEKIIAEAEA